MNKNFNAPLFSGILVIILVCAVGLVYIFPNQIRYTLSIVETQWAAVLLSHNFKTVAQIKKNYELASEEPSTKKVRILIVPGHDPNYGGAAFKEVWERDLAVELAEELKGFFAGDEHYEIIVTRDKNSWRGEFEIYFQTNWEGIKEWRAASHAQFHSMVNMGVVSVAKPTVYHNSAPSEVATRLYGVTKWSNEHDVDIVIHVHFNDNPRKKISLPGENSGFTIYVPAEQYGNSATTKTIANGIFKRLEKYNPVSSLPGESGGVVDEPELIAIGANNTSDAASMLIEYSYIYEPQLQNPSIRKATMKELAYETYLGLQDFFDPTKTSQMGDTAILPYSWNANAGPATSMDVFALQTALMIEGVYPPAGKSKNDCPRTGKLGPCTLTSLQIFQDKQGIKGEAGKIGPKTRAVLSESY